MFISKLQKPEVPEDCIHKHLWSYFDLPDGSDRPFLYRVDSNIITMLSRIEPACDNVNISAHIKSGKSYQFSADLNLVKGNTHSKDGKRRFYSIRSNNERREFFNRRMSCADVKMVQFFDRPRKTLKRAGGVLVQLDICKATGVLRVNDRSEFINTMLSGIGKGKVYGYGLIKLIGIM